jgi:hypothetical protein
LLVYGLNGNTPLVEKELPDPVILAPWMVALYPALDSERVKVWLLSLKLQDPFTGWGPDGEDALPDQVPFELKTYGPDPAECQSDLAPLTSQVATRSFR